MYDYEEMWYEKYIEEKKRRERLESELSEARRAAEERQDYIEWRNRSQEDVWENGPLLKMPPGELPWRGKDEV